MLQQLKEKLAAKKANNKAVAESQYWKNHARMQYCLQAMRGSCTVVPMQMHEAVVSVVNIALLEDSWTETPGIPADFFGETLFLVWNNEKLPVLKAPFFLAEEKLSDIRAVSGETFLVAETMDRIIWFDGLGRIKLYSIA